ncbi:PREDICTED: zinc finger protein CONSTANS-LIKE 9-like isoform X2 [Ipomoea nil]|uniref:zinc finger protein CONSTANS-LIKE 9-like isoform X2 n=1 Tax=Ipomoea nil TaxID=35883 RepID=UPI0009015B7A|nr:PREDICTED: zinc finger protein CONSTANS-LIKE 9-like isoform X2 [Ipomoea nil]
MACNYSGIYCHGVQSYSSRDFLVASAISEYDLGGEGDLFNVPEPLIEEPLLDIDPMTAAISMISCGDDVMSHQGLRISDIESSFENEQLFNDVFYDCKKDLLGSPEVLDVKIPIANTDERLAAEELLAPEGVFQKSGSSESLSSMEWVQGAPPTMPNFLAFPGMDFGAVYGMRRSYSEGDIKTLGNGNVSLIHSPKGHQPIISSAISEDRQEKLSRYRSKRNKRNFGRKIKYACRKALADSQPRIRGRFARTEEAADASSKKH